jgi:hypothetical protein
MSYEHIRMQKPGLIELIGAACQNSAGALQRGDQSGARLR